MLITVSGITTAESELAAKALPPISVTLPRSTDEAFVYAKAHEPIYLTFSGTVYAAVLPAGYATTFRALYAALICDIILQIRLHKNASIKFGFAIDICGSL